MEAVVAPDEWFALYDRAGQSMLLVAAERTKDFLNQ